MMFTFTTQRRIDMSKNKVLKAMVFINAIALIVSVSMLDSLSMIPTYVAFVSGLFLMLFFIANRKEIGD